MSVKVHEVILLLNKYPDLLRRVQHTRCHADFMAQILQIAESHELLLEELELMNRGSQTHRAINSEEIHPRSDTQPAW